MRLIRPTSGRSRARRLKAEAISSRSGRNTNGGDGGSLGVDGGDGTGTGAILGATATPVALTPASLAPTGSSGDDGGGSGGQGDGEFVNGDTNQIVPFGEPVFGDLAGFVSFVPDWIIIALIALAALSLLLGTGYLLLRTPRAPA